MATEKRLIDANALVERLEYNTTDTWAKNLKAIRNWWSHAVGIKDNIVRMIENAPTVDAVEVVRCKDCKHYHQYHYGKTEDLCEWGKCQLINMDVDMPENGFCCFGERRTDNA